MNEEILKSDEIKPKKAGRVYFGFLLFAGVLLPAATFLIEIGSRWCAGNFFDPMPTWWHVFFVFFVPFANAQTLWAIHKNRLETISWLGFANAAAIFISLFYTIVFLPITPIAIIAIIFFFAGLLPLAPLFSLIAGLLLRRELKKNAPPEKPLTLQWKGLILGFALILICVSLAEIPFALTKIGIQRANSENVEEQNAGLAFLRRYGNQDYLLRLCYGGPNMVSTDWVVKLLITGQFGGSSNDSLREPAQKAFYRLTGKHYHQLPTPRSVRNWERFESNSFDTADASRINDGLSLAASQMDGTIDGDAALGYLEWTLVFKNEKTWQQESVSEIQLPPNAVVSRLTLWINGEEREAAFAKSAKVIEAYNAVTAKRRDPALVTMIGKDRIQLKCSPIEPKSEMKVRIGITVPLILESETDSMMLLPYFQDRNFKVSTDHSVWVESKKELKTSHQTLAREQTDDVFGVRGKVKNDDLLKTNAPIRVQKSENIKTAWAKDVNNPKFFVKQEIKQSEKPKIERLILVVDASAQMKDFQMEIVEAVKKITPEVEIDLILTGGNGYNAELSAPNSISGSSSEIADKISEASFEGGTDSVPAIEKAREISQEKPNSAIVWVHAPQSVELTSPHNLIQPQTRRPNSTPIYSLQTRTGKDAVGRILNESDAVKIVPRFGSLQQDLTNLFADLNAQKPQYEFVRINENIPAKFSGFPDSKETSQHLVRLWANDQVKRLLTANEAEKAVELAVKNQLVTPVSGAVVLETKQQYEQFGLRPVEPNTVPTIPEPEEYLLFGVVLAILIWMFWRFRRNKTQNLEAI